ncbi:TPA: hypothetical protein JD264_24040 [Serratia fonticola]|nr:hypothetical protein [Serratia fonticola]
MNLGPASLKLNHRHIMNSKSAKRIIKRYYAGKIDWGHKDLAGIKRKLRLSLRLQQQARCIFCRRIIKQERRNTNEDIEHFLDKSKQHYKRWAFNSLNLALSCHACNFVKSKNEMGDVSVQTAQWLIPGIGVFRWLHPYFDNYHDNITIEKGWVYKIKPTAPNRTPALNLINDCELYSIEGIEKNAEAFKRKVSRMASITTKLIKSKRYARAQKMSEATEFFIEQDWFNF